MLSSYAVRKFLPARRVFRTSRDAKPGVENVFLVLRQNGIIGLGEAGPNRYFGESAEAVHLQLLGLSDFLRRHTLVSVSDIERIGSDAIQAYALTPAAACAVDLALWDLWGKTQGQSVAELCWGMPATPVTTAVTLSVSLPGEGNDRLDEVKHFPLVKVKMDAAAELSPLLQLKAAGVQRLLVDANAAWSPEQCAQLLPQLFELGVEAVEQPLPPAQDALMADLARESPIPLLADESCRTLADIPRLAGLFTGVNIKLVKCGGLSCALKMLSAARAQHFKVMVGCMLESPVLIAAGMVVAQKTDWADLDGSWLLAQSTQNEFTGPKIHAGHLLPSTHPGLGVDIIGMEADPC